MVLVYRISVLDPKATYVIRQFNSKKEIYKYLKLVDGKFGLGKAIDNKTIYHNYYWKYQDQFKINCNKEVQPIEKQKNLNIG